MDEPRLKYKKLGKLGEGTYGTVYKAQDPTTGTVVALKKMKIGEHEEGTPVTALREIAILQTLNHAGIVK
jgi:cyclin-dependent kinase 2